jgi:tetratricopeptide (TPR) repeat protein
MSISGTTIPVRGLRPLVIGVLALAIACSGCSGADARKGRYLEKAQGFVAKADYQKAQIELRNALQIDPNFAPAQLLSAEVAERLGDPRRALQMYQAALDQDANSIPARAGVARIYVFGGLPEKGMEIVAAGLTRNPDDPTLLTVRGAAKAALGDAKGAIVDAEKALASAPSSESTVALLAPLYLQQGRADDARKLVETAIGAAPKNVGLRIVLADMYLRTGQSAQSEKLLREVISMEPTVIAHRYTLARFLVAEKRVDAAAQVLREVIVQEPDNIEAKTALVNLLATGQSFEAAEKELLGFVKASPKDMEVRLALGDFYNERDKAAQAARVYGEIVERDRDGPQGLAARNRLAAAALREQRLADATRLIDEVLAVNAQDNDALILRADMALARGDAPAAITDLRTVLRDKPDAAPVQRALARAYVQSNDLALAEETLKTAIATNPGDEQLRVDYARLLMRTGDGDRALKSLEDTVAETPTNLAAQEQLFMVYVSRNDLGKARQTAAAVKSARPDLPLGDYLTGLVDRADGKFDAALASYEAALRLQPNGKEPLTAIVELLVSQKRSDEALARLARAAVEQPQSALVRNLQGELLTSTRRLPEAIAAFDSAIGLSAEWWVPYRGKSIAQLLQQQPAAAMQTMERGVKETGGAATLVVDLASLYEKSGQTDKAIALYDDLLKKNPDSDAFANNLAMLLSTYRSDPQSLERARALSEKFKDSPTAAYVNTSGWVAYRQGRYEEAVALLKRATEKEPNAPLMRYQLALAQIKTGQVDQARRNLEDALKVGGSLPWAGQAREQLEQLQRS